MSVFTSMNKAAFESVLSNYHLGELYDFQPISAGVTNSNFFVNTTMGSYVFTIFEEHSANELTFFFDLMTYYADRAIPAPKTIRDSHGHYLQTIQNKPAVIIECLPGEWATNPSLKQCAAVGKLLGKMHCLGETYSPRQKNYRDINWFKKTALLVLPHLSKPDQTLLRSEIVFHDAQDYSSLPCGIIHADLFIDNVLFMQDELTGVIDFYYACYDKLLFDVAVTVNAWCRTVQGMLDEQRYYSLLEAYEEQRPLTYYEKQSWSAMLRLAALRFWLSRLNDYYKFRQTHVQIHDPNEFKTILLDAKQGTNK